MQNLRDDMPKLVKRIEEAFSVAAEAITDVHHRVCERIADEFELWQPNDSGGESFPLWLSYVVQGVGRDLGYLD